MARMIEGIAVTLYQKTRTGTDPFGAPVYTESPVVVPNVLVTPVSAEALTEAGRLYGKRAVYELCIPKGDTHTWEDSRVEFWGQSFRTFGFVQRYIERDLPLDWNAKVKVERYG